jgi:putative colanic acid biosynthesis UDP-glucose lipid carrier transferase
MIKRVNADIHYLQNWSFSLDMKIVWLTVYQAVKGTENAF